MANKKSFTEIYDSLSPGQQSTYHHVLLGTSTNEYATAEGITLKAASRRREDLFKKFNVHVVRGRNNGVKNNMTFINHILSISK